MIALDTWRRELKVVYDDDRGEKRKVAVVAQNETREPLPSLRITGIEKDLSRVVFGLSLIHI